MSPSWASCFSATCRSFWGSPSRSRRSFSPYRLPRPMVRFVLRGHAGLSATSPGTGRRHRGGEHEELCAAGPPVVLDLLLDLGHHHLLSLKEGGSDIVPVPQASLWVTEEGIRWQRSPKGRARRIPWLPRGRL